MIILAVHCTLKPGKASEFEKAVSAFIAEVRASEPGCLAFQASRSTDDPNHYLLYEVYTDAAALEVHRAASYFKEFSHNLLPTLLDMRVREVYEWVAG